MIKRKSDSTKFIRTFEQFAGFDGTKHYFAFVHPEGGTVTLMKYPNGRFTLYQKTDRYWDIKERVLTDKELPRYLWENRKPINSRLKEKVPNG